MSYRNTMKLFVSNFALAWKQLVYFLICAFLFAVCSYTLISPVISILREAGLFSEIKNLITLVYDNPKDIAMTVSAIVKLVLTSIWTNFSKIYINLIAVLILCFILPYILYQVSIFNVSSILHQKLTMNMEVGYTQNYIGNFNKALKFAFASLVFSLPFFIINIGLVIAYVYIANTIFKALIGLMILSLLTITLDSVKLTLFTHYTGNVIANNANPFSAFGKSLKHELKNFWKIMGYSVVISLTSILINGIIGVFTLFAGLLFSIPATCVLVCIFKIVIFLNINGNRYYLSNSVIYNPQKYVIKKDDYVSTFIPPEEIKEITTTKMKKKYKTKTLKDKPKKATKAKKSNKTKKSKKENLKG